MTGPGEPHVGLDDHALARVLATQADAVSVMGMNDGIIRFTNAAFDSLLGYEPGVLAGQSVLDLNLLEPVAMDDVITELVAGGVVRSGQSVARRADGQIIRLVHSTTFIEIDGEPHAISTVFGPDDVRAEIADSMSDAEQRLRFMLDEAPITVSIKDTDCRYLYVNRRFLDDSGLDVGDFLGHTPTEVFGEEAGAAIERDDRDVLANGEPRLAERPAAYAGGSTRTYLFAKFALRGRDGSIVGCGTFGVDFTETRLAQQALEESERRFRQLAESLDDAFMLISTAPIQVLYISPNFAAVTGISLSQLSADTSSYEGLLHPDDRDEVTGAVADLGSENQSGTIEFRVLQPDGSIRWLRSRSRSVSGAEGDGRVRVAITMADITREREIDQALEQALDRAEQANRRKNEFLSNMSHELRTPLNAILGFGQLLELDGATLKPDQRDAVSHICSAGEHLLDLINEVLDIARIESGELRPSLEPVGLAAIVAEATDLVRSIAADRGVTIEIGHRAPDPIGVRADRQRLRQILLNLLSNAIKYNRRRDGRVTIDWALRSDVVELTVTDTGTGIAPDDLERLFRPFERLDNAAGIEGTGIGLALTRQLIETMHGTIGVDSTVGQGSTFTVRLPAVDPDGRKAEHTIENRTERETEERRGPDLDRGIDQARVPRRRVLYVEDNAANIELVERALARLPSVHLVIATRGADVVEVLKRTPIDLVLLDLQLPDMSGDAVLRQLRLDPALVDLPVIVISADATPDRIDRMLQQGATDYLTKPFDLHRLLELVRLRLPDPPERPEGA